MAPEWTTNERDLKFFPKNLLKIIDPAYKFHPEILTRTTTAVKSAIRRETRNIKVKEEEEKEKKRDVAFEENLVA